MISRPIEWLLFLVFLLNHFYGLGPNVYTKTLCSLLFVYIGAIKMNNNKSLPVYLIFIALIFAIAGDVLLAIKGGFMIGGFSFLLCHVFYALAFIVLFKQNFRMNANYVISALIPVILAATVCYGYGYLFIITQIKDKSYDVLVIPYFCVISIMTSLSSGGDSMGVSGKSYVSFLANWVKKIFFSNQPFSDLERTYLRVVGAVLFCISDIFVARQQFLVHSPYNSLIGLPIYYIAQNFIAYSM